METKCLNCGRHLSGKREGAKFCGQACKNKYSYKHRLGELKGIGTPEQKKEIKKEEPNTLLESMRGVIHTKQTKSIEEEKESRTEPNNSDADFLSGLLGDNFFGQTEQQEFVNENTSTNQRQYKEPEPVLPPMFIPKEIKTVNIEHLTKKQNLAIFKKQKESLEQEFVKLEQRLQDERARNGNDLIVKGAIGGGLLSLIGKPSFGKLALFTALGLGAGALGKNITKESREQEKQINIDAILKRIYEIKKEYAETEKNIKSTESALKFLFPQNTEIRQVINPEYTKALAAQKTVNNTFSGFNFTEKEKPKPTTERKIHKPITPIQQIKFKSNKIMKAKDLGDLNYHEIEFKGLWKEFFGKPEVNFSCLIHGNSGEGKSTFCMWFARYLAENFGRVLYVSAEEGLNKTFQDKLKYCEAEVDNFYILDVNSADEFLNEVGTNEFHFIILDSLHDMGIDGKKMKEIMLAYNKTSFINIDQNNKKGDLLGNNDKKHLHDIVVNVKDYTAETTKNRFMERGVVLKTADFMESVSPKGSHLKNIKPSNPSDDPNEGYDLNDDRQNIV